MQTISNAMEGEISTNVPELPNIPYITVQTSTVSVINQVSPATMAEEETKDSVLGLVIQYMHMGKPKSSAFSKINSKAVCKYLLQFDRLELKQGVLHWLDISNVESHQLALPTIYHQAILQMLHDENGHHGLDHTLTLAKERLYWTTMYLDVAEYVTICHRCNVTKVTTQVHIHSRGHWLPIIP